MALAAKLLKAQRAFPKLGKNATNPHYRNAYISLDDLIEAIVPILNDHGIVLMQHPTIGEDNAPTLTTYLIEAEDDTGDEVIESEMPLLLDKNNSQGLGSAITYARRYSLMSILGLAADDDDDGNAASTSEAKKAARDTGESPVTGPII